MDMLRALVALVLTQVAQAPLAGYLSTTATSLGDDDLLRLPPGLRLLNESLRVPFGDDWGGEMRTSIEFGERVSFGAFMKAWSDGVCDPHWCQSRAIHMGADAQIRVTPSLDLNVGYEIGRGTSPGRSGMIRARWKF